MANTYNYVQSTGVIVPDTSTIKETVEGEFKDALGQDLDVTSSTPQGRLIEAETISRADVLATNALVANAMNPTTAYGTFLDAVCALTGTTRKSATRTEVLATLRGRVGTVIPAGVQAQTEAGDVFELVSAYTIPQGGVGQSYFQASQTGPVPCAVGTLNQIVTPVMGWETINNPVAAVIGVDVESDTSLRARRIEEMYKGVALLESIESAVKQVEGVLSVYAYENYTNGIQEVDGVTINAHSIYVVVDGGADEDIAQAIWKHKSLGCGYTGDVEVTVYGTYRTPYTVKFNRPTFQPITVNVSVTVPTDSNTEDITSQVKNALSAWANGEIVGVDGLSLGTNVSPFEAASAITAQLPDLFVTNVEVGFHGETPSTSTLNIKVFEKATLSQENINVTVNESTL